jgi:hypothetical protein
VYEHAFVHVAHVVNQALDLLLRGSTPRVVARELGIPARTIRGWRSGMVPRQGSRSLEIDWESVRTPPYAYLLGLYLGDGWIAQLARTYALRIALDDRYPVIIASAARAMAAIHPRGSVRIASRNGCSVVYSSWNHWPAVLPQHGAGRKHLRRIALTAWQAEITARYPHDLIRGLIHSDGCRFVANQRVSGRTYSYARYSFSNRSDDIKAIFCDHLDLLGIRWTRPNRWSIAIDRRSEVARLDSFVGPKR